MGTTFVHIGAMVGPCYRKCLDALGYNPGTIGACCGEKLSRANARRDFAMPRVSFKYLEQNLNAGTCTNVLRTTYNLSRMLPEVDFLIV